MRVAALLALWGAAAAAEPVAVRTGDHAAFARLVVDLPAGAAWDLAPAPGGYALSLPPDLEPDLSRAFDRIPRTRLAVLEPLGEGRLGLRLACDCHAVTSMDGPSLVVDVTDGPAPPGVEGPGEAPAVSPVAVPPVDPDAAPASDAVVEGFMRAAALGLIEVADPESLPEPPPAEVASTPLVGAPDPRPAAEPSPHGDPAGEAPATPSVTAPRPPPPHEDAGDALAALAGQPGLSLRTGLDGTLADPPAPLATDGDPCLPPDDFDLAAWAPSGDFGSEVSARSAALTTERDGWAAGAAEDLARAYVAFGFGREAAHALDLDGQASAGRDHLRVLAALVDGDAAPGAFADQGGCLGPVALWRALARGTLEGTDARERTAVTVALRALPDAARGHLAVTTARLFLDAGDATSAEAILEGATDAVTGEGPEARLAAAAVTEATQGPGPALAALADLADTDPRMTPEGVVRLIDLSLAEGEPVAYDVLELARSMRAELGDGDAARALLLAEARGLAAGLRFDEALDVLGHEGGALPPPVRDAAVADVVLAMVAGLDDAAFLDWSLGRRPDDLPPDAIAAVARRLGDVGFEPEARALLAEEGVEAAPKGPTVAPPDAEPRPPAPAAASDTIPGEAPSDALSLADRQALLDRAGATRDRATALLAASP